jgi:opacity protein-like surface antigen
LTIFAQAQKNSGFSTSIHYVGNLRNENVISNNFNGVLGLDFRYNFNEKLDKPIKVFLGIDFSLLKGRDAANSLTKVNYKNSILFNPYLGIEFNKISKKFKPNLAIGFGSMNSRFDTYSFLNYSPDFDPMINNSVREIKFSYNSISIAPEIRYFITPNLFSNINYKYIPFGNKVNVHLINFGVGYKF